MIPSDNVMLLCYVNMKLRDFYKNFDEMCDDLEIDPIYIIERLGEEGYRYDETLNRFVEV